MKMFKYFDIYDKGAVDFRSFNQSMEKIGLYYGERDMLALFQHYDKNNSGTLDYHEFAEGIFGVNSGKG